MMQFGLVSYQDQPDYASSLAFIEHFKRARAVDPVARKLLRDALATNNSIGKSALMTARLHFWGHLDHTATRLELNSRVTSDTFSAADVFEKQELFDCLGPALLADLIGSEFDTSSLYTGWDTADYITDLSGINPSPQEAWCYVPPPTGFFSVMENIVLAKFFCKVHNKAFKLDLQHNWWRYPVPFLDLLGGYDIAEFNLDMPHDKYIMWDVLRQYFRYIHPGNFNFLKKFKAQEYRKIKRTLRLYLDSTDSRPRPAPEDCIVFIRGGDKVQIETIEAPQQFIHADIATLRARGTDVRVLSDDHGLAESLIATLGLSSDANLTARNRAGYHLHAGHSLNDVHTIIHNYLMLANARYSISCPSSNLVNSAHWSNQILDDSFRPRSLPSLRFLYL